MRGVFYPNLFVKIGRFGIKDVDLRFQEVCEGNLIQILRDVMEQLEKKFLTKPIRFEGIQRIEELEYPVAALREILLNALVHRNYLGSMTQMKVYDDRLTLWNAGALPEEMTIERLYQPHESIPRNPLIAEVCYKAGYIDSWGRGVEKITDACRKSGLADPIFMERSGGLLVELKKTPVKTSVKTPVKTPEAILALLRKDSTLTLAEIAASIGKSVRTIERAAKKLRDQGKLQYIGSQKEGHWEIIE